MYGHWCAMCVAGVQVLEANDLILSVLSKYEVLISSNRMWCFQHVHKAGHMLESGQRLGAILEINGFTSVF